MVDKVIQTEEEYEEIISRIEALMSKEERSEEEREELHELVLIMEAYENIHSWDDSHGKK